MIYAGGHGVLIEGDAMEVLKHIPDESIDLILTDPPYNVSKKGNDIVDVRGKKKRKIKLYFGEWDEGKITWKDFIDDFVRVLKPNGVLVLFYEKLELGCIGKYLSEEHGFQVRHVGAWVKTNPVPQMRKVKWQNALEFFLIATKNKGTGHHFNWKLGQSPDYFKHSVSYKHYHPTQKPPKMIEWILEFRGGRSSRPLCGSWDNLVDC